MSGRISARPSYVAWSHPGGGTVTTEDGRLPRCHSDRRLCYFRVSLSLYHLLLLHGSYLRYMECHSQTFVSLSGAIRIIDNLHDASVDLGRWQGQGSNLYTVS